MSNVWALTFRRRRLLSFLVYFLYTALSDDYFTAMTSLTPWGYPLQPKLHFYSFTNWLFMVSHGLQFCHTFLDLSGSLKPWRKDPWPLHSCIFYVSNVSITWMDDTVWLPAWDGPSISSAFHMLKQLVSRRKQLFWVSPLTSWKTSWAESYPEDTLPIVPRTTDTSLMVSIPLITSHLSSCVLAIISFLVLSFSPNCVCVFLKKFLSILFALFHCRPTWVISNNHITDSMLCCLEISSAKETLLLF